MRTHGDGRRRRGDGNRRDRRQGRRGGSRRGGAGRGGRLIRCRWRDVESGKGSDRQQNQHDDDRTGSDDQHLATVGLEPSRRCRFGVRCCHQFGFCVCHQLFSSQQGAGSVSRESAGRDSSWQHLPSSQASSRERNAGAISRHIAFARFASIEPSRLLGRHLKHRHRPGVRRPTAIGDEQR